MELSFDLMKQFMRNAPVNIFFKDTECKYLFASEICSLVYADEDGGITGKTDLEIQSIPELGRFYYENDKKIPPYLYSYILLHWIKYSPKYNRCHHIFHFLLIN